VHVHSGALRTHGKEPSDVDQSRNTVTSFTRSVEPHTVHLHMERCRKGKMQELSRVALMIHRSLPLTCSTPAVAPPIRTTYHSSLSICQDCSSARVGDDVQQPNNITKAPPTTFISRSVGVKTLRGRLDIKSANLAVWMIDCTGS
jgi:hypothetical protein